MPTARYYKTLFLPQLEGQYLLWKHSLAKVAARVDEVLSLGNLIGCFERVKDGERLGANLATLNFILLWKATYPNWTQLIGPNEIMALNFPDEWTNAESNRALRGAWLLEKEKGFFKVAAANRGRLVSAGGLTHGEWLALGRPGTAAEAAEALNAKYSGTLYQGRAYRTSGKISFSANPIFADPLRETYPSWLVADEDPPFGQVHSNGGLNTRSGRQALTEVYNPLGMLEDLTYTAYGSRCLLRGAPFYSVAPEIPQAEAVKRLPPPWEVYIERTPVVDMRDEYFKEALA